LGSGTSGLGNSGLGSSNSGIDNGYRVSCPGLVGVTSISQYPRDPLPIYVYTCISYLSIYYFWPYLLLGIKRPGLLSPVSPSPTLSHARLPGYALHANSVVLRASTWPPTSFSHNHRQQGQGQGHRHVTVRLRRAQVGTCGSPSPRQHY